MKLRPFLTVREERIVQYLDLKFAQAKDENDALGRRLDRQEQTPKFNKKGHEQQFSFNLGIPNDLETLAGLLEQGRVTKSKSIVAEAVRKVEYRNKLIKLADRSNQIRF